MKNKDHTPVLLQEVLEYLEVREGEKYIDATVGMGGHARQIVEKGGVVLGIDRDKESLRKLKLQSEKSKIQTKRLKLFHGNFANLKAIAEKNKFFNVAGVLFDLGLSSWQLEKSGRGFGYQRDEPLDMRMDRGKSVTAADLINRSTREELYEIFSKFGEEQRSGRIAQAVFRAHPIVTTGRLRKVIEKATKGAGMAGQRTIARIFQALRIAINNELNNLSLALPQALVLLKPGGRLLVISFHSLEDRIVKRFLKDCVRNKMGAVLTKKAIRPTREEIKRNKKAASAKLRVLEKL